MEIRSRGLIVLASLALVVSTCIAVPPATAECEGIEMCEFPPFNDPPAVCIENGEVKTGDCIQIFP